MMKTFVRAAFAASLLGIAAGAAVAISSSAAFAEDKAPAAPAVSRAVGVPLYEAQKLSQAGDFVGALAKVKEAQAVDKRTPYDDYAINKFLGYIAINLNDNVTALAAYNAMISSPMFDDADKPAAYLNAFVLSSMTKNYDDTIKFGKLLEGLKPLDYKADAMMAQAYYIKNDGPNASIYAQKSSDAAKAAGMPADPFVLQLLMGAQAKSHDEAGAVATLEQLAVVENTASDWSQLVGVALGTKNIRDIDALYLYRLNFMVGGMKTSDDYTIFAHIAMQLGYPGEAKEVLEQGVNAGKIGGGSSEAGGLLAQAKSGANADENALGGIAAAAAKAKSGEQDVKLAEDYWGYGRFSDAEAAARSAIAKGAMKDDGEGYFILGIALVAQNKNIEAEDALAKVGGAPPRAKAAHLWGLYAKAKAKAMGQDNSCRQPACRPDPGTGASPGINPGARTRAVKP